MPKLEIRKNEFVIDEKPLKIYSGAIHYFRVMPEYWEDRLLKLKLAGFNTVETYVCWNLHEEKRGVFNFDGILDIEKFIDIANKLGLYAIVRPGPYICSEWDFGGLPAWLLKDENMRIRCNYEPYLKHVEDFYRELLKRLVSRQITKGGNIIAMQIENEYGSYGNDKDYLRFIEKLMIECGVDTLLFTSDGATDMMLSGGTLENIFKTANFGSRTKSEFEKLREYQPEGPLMCAEFWNGWFDHFGEVHNAREPESVVEEMKTMFELGASVNFYMFHGGTNFGFTAGANHDGKYQPTISSYDDNALLNEWGGYTPKYHAVRDALLAHQNMEKKELPAEPALQNIGTVELNKFASLMENIEALGEKHESAAPMHMEYYDQSFGMILYHHDLKGRYNDMNLFIDGLGDKAYVFADENYQGSIYRNDEEQSVFVETDDETGISSIDVLIDAMGRVNYGPMLYDRKGAKQIRLGNQLLFGWSVYTLPLNNIEKLTYKNKLAEKPLFLKGVFKAEPNASCFVHLKGFKKGYVFVNGFNLGRYWEIGPQKSLYIPGVLLKDKNEIVVLELEDFEEAKVEITDIHDIG